MAGICPMCGAPIEKNECEYCGYEMEVPEEEIQNESENEERTIYIQPKIIINAQFTPDESEDTSEETSEETVEIVSRKSRILAFIFCFFLGYFGLHQFYVGKIAWGVLYLFTAGIFGFGWIIDMILILIGRFKDADGYRVYKFF